MTWNYRIVKYADGTGFGLHRVYYNKAGDATQMNESPAAFVGDTAEEVRSALITARIDAVRRPVFDEPPK